MKAIKTIIACGLVALILSVNIKSEVPSEVCVNKIEGDFCGHEGNRHCLRDLDGGDYLVCR